MAREMQPKLKVDDRVRVVGTGDPTLAGRTGTIVHRYRFSQTNTPEYVVRLDHDGPGDEDWNIMENHLEALNNNK